MVHYTKRASEKTLGTRLEFKDTGPSCNSMIQALKLIFYPANYGKLSVKVENEMYKTIKFTCFELDYLKHIFPKVINT